MHRFGHGRPRPLWMHIAFAVVLVAVLVAVVAYAGGVPTTADADAKFGELLFGLAIAFVLSTVVSPYAGPLLIGAAAVTDAIVNPSGIDETTFAVAVPLLLCSATYYVLHAWVTVEVWRLSDGASEDLADSVRERRALVLEIGRRFLVAWLLLFVLTLLAIEDSGFGANVHGVLTAVRDAGGVVVVIDLLAVAPTRFWEARRVFNGHRRRAAALSPEPPAPEPPREPSAPEPSTPEPPVPAAGTGAHGRHELVSGE